MTLPTMLLVVLLAAATAMAAIPPLSRERLVDGSSVIITGKITKVTTSVRKTREGHSDTVFHVDVEIATVEKGNTERGKPARMTMWKPLDRPDGWVGHQGQNERPVEGATVRCYLNGDEKAGYELLEPNGLEVLRPATTKP